MILMQGWSTDQNNSCTLIVVSNASRVVAQSTRKKNRFPLYLMKGLFSTFQLLFFVYAGIQNYLTLL